MEQDGAYPDPCETVQGHVERCIVCQKTLRCSPFEKRLAKSINVIEIALFICLVVATVVLIGTIVTIK